MRVNIVLYFFDEEDEDRSCVVKGSDCTYGKVLNAKIHSYWSESHVEDTNHDKFES